MNYTANLSATYSHHMLLLLLFNLFSSQSHVKPPTPPQKKKPNNVFIQMDTQTDTHLLHAVHFDRGGCNWVCNIDPHDS